MKYINIKSLFFIGLILLACEALAQTPFYTMKPIYITDDARISGVSLKNTWLNSKLTLELNDDGFLRDNFVFSAKVLYVPLYGSNYAFPIVSSAALNNTNIFNPESGFNIGIYPYYVLYESARTIFVLHGGIGYKTLPKKEVSDLSIEQVRFLAGVEGLFYQKSLTPTSLSITPIYWNNFNADNDIGIEVTGIIPIGVDLGILGELTKPFSTPMTGFRMGIIVNSL